MFDLPRIRIEVENMKYQIVHAFSSHNDEIEKAVEAELTKVIDNYPFSEVVTTTAREILKNAIKSSLEDYLLYGEGRKLLQERIDAIVKEVIKQE